MMRGPRGGFKKRRVGVQVKFLEGFALLKAPPGGRVDGVGLGARQRGQRG